MLIIGCDFHTRYQQNARAEHRQASNVGHRPALQNQRLGARAC